MDNIRTLPTAMNVDTAWQRYQALAAEMTANPALCTDRAHVEATLRAHRQFAALFDEAERAA